MTDYAGNTIPVNTCFTESCGRSQKAQWGRIRWHWRRKVWSADCVNNRCVRTVVLFGGVSDTVPGDPRPPGQYGSIPPQLWQVAVDPR